MGVRYRNTFYSIAGVQWKIDIHDTLYSSTVTLFETSGNGFNQSYRGLTERMDVQFASSVVVPMSIANTTMEAFLLSVMSAQEDQFSVKVYKDNVLDWVGVLLSDQVQKEDIGFPYICDLTFTDGLARLKDIDYNTGGSTPVPYTGRDAIVSHLIKILGKTGTASLYGSSDNFLQTTVNWYDVRHPYNPLYCPLFYTNIDHAIFYSYDDSGTIQYKKTSEVLDMILRTFNARIVMANGLWHVIQAQEYARPTTYSRKFTTSGGSSTTYSANNFRVTPTALMRKTGGMTKYFAPLKKVIKKYKSRRTPYDNNSLWPLPVPTLSLGPVALMSNLNNGETVKFSGIIRTWYSSSNPYPPDLWSKFRIRIILTKLSDSSVIYLVDNTYSGNPHWSATSGAVAVKAGPYSAGNFFDEEVTVEFTLPILSSEYSGACDAVFNGLFTGGGYAYTLVTGEQFNWEFREFTLIVENSDTETDFTATNTIAGGSPVNSTIELKIPDTLLGDGPVSTSLGRLQTNNLTSYANSTVWGIHNSTTRVKINQLSVNQNLAGQRVPTDKYTGSFVSTTINALSSISLFGKVFVPVVITINPTLDEVSGEWFNVIIPVL